MGTQQNQNQKNANKPNQSATNKNVQPAQNTVKPPVATDASEDTISGYLRDVVKSVKKSKKAYDALAELGANNSEELKPAFDALKSRKEVLAKAAAQRVYDYIMKVE